MGSEHGESYLWLPDAAALRHRLAAWEATAADPFTAYHDRLLGTYLAGLRRLLEREPDRMRAVLLAALAIGPRDAGLPDASDLAPLVHLAATTTADVLDLAIAWGCGWRRMVWPGQRWHARWIAAVLALSHLAAGSIHRAVRLLGETAPQFGRTLRASGEREVRERLGGYAELIAVELAAGGCRCGRGNASHRSPTGVCGRREHRLERWAPEDCRLRAFVATAVRGSAGPAVTVGAFSVSMLAGLLRADHLLQVDTAEFRVCHACNGDIIRSAAQRGSRIDLSSISDGLYELGRCPTCDSPHDPERTYRVGRKNWLIVPAEWGGQHHPVQRYRCASCGNLFTLERTRCPICCTTVRHLDRRTRVWVHLAS